MKFIPTRYTLIEIYATIYKGLKEKGVNPKDLLLSNHRAVNLTEEVHQVFKDCLKDYDFEQQIYLRSLNDAQRYFIGDAMMYVALILNELFPRFRDLETVEKGGDLQVERFKERKVITADELAFEHLAFESPAYLRRMITSAVSSCEYAFRHTALSDKTQDGMEKISADWLLSRQKFDEEFLTISSLVGTDGKCVSLSTNIQEPRFKFIVEVMPSLVKLSEFKRSDTSHFSKFVTLLPSLINWVIGNGAKTLTPADEDPIMDLLETTMTFTRSLQANAETAARLRQMIHHGFPVYKELLQLSSAQSNLISWNFESIILRLSYNMKMMLSDKENSEIVQKFLSQTGILALYAKHKDAYIER